jgi:hypothetical protein
MVDAALTATGMMGKVKVVALDMVDSNIDLLRKNDGSIAVDIGGAPGWLGWAEFDQLSRGILGLQKVHEEIPMRLIDITNVPATYAGLFEGADYQNGYLQVWGLK